MTLTGYLALNSLIALVWMASENNCVKSKIDTYCQRCESSAGTIISGNIRFVRLFGRVL